MALYLGIDSSTQGGKAIVIDPAAGRITHTASVNYGADLPEYGCPEGVLPHPDPRVKHADPLLWVAGLELLLVRLKESGLPMGSVAGIGGDGQQHGSVYLGPGFEDVFEGLDPGRPLAPQVAPALSRPTSPIWMDGSTSEECRELEGAFGARLRRETGSPAIERFTGPQIRRFARTEPERYVATARVHLVSSFLCSILVGRDAPIDFGDGAGMNLLNLRTLAWDPEITAFTAPGLARRLPHLATDGVAGGLHPHFARYGLTPGIPVAVFTGDNPASLVGTGAFRPGIAVVSLGTSDTFFAALDPFRTDPDGCGHVFGNPAGGFMCLACFKNGSLARDRVRREAGVDWEFFGRSAFERTPPGNEGRLALPWFEPEITPPSERTGLRASFDFDAAAPEVRVRSVVEAQALALRAHSLWIGDFDTLRVTGGGSRSPGILKVLADVFQARVETISAADSAPLGAAMLAAHAAGGVPFDELSAAFAPVAASVSPDPSNALTYRDALGALRELERDPA